MTRRTPPRAASGRRSRRPKTPDALEAAARDWLNEINRINTEAREATATATREHAAAAAIGATLERLGLEADAARIGAENADAACLQARIAVADCDERTASDEATLLLAAAPSEPWPPRLDEDETLGMAFEGGGTPGSSGCCAATARR